VKVEESVNWVNNLVSVEKKNNSLRLSLDPPDVKPPSFEKILNTLECKSQGFYTFFLNVYVNYISQ